jgi:hypothetical protein
LLNRPASMSGVCALLWCGAAVIGRGSSEARLWAQKTF